MHPSNPLELFLGNEETDAPTLIPTREPVVDLEVLRRRIAALSRGDYHSYDDLPSPSSPAPFGPLDDDGVDDAVHNDGDDNDDIPPLVGEATPLDPASPSLQARPYFRSDIPPWLDPDVAFNPAQSFARLNEYVRTFENATPDAMDVD